MTNTRTSQERPETLRGSERHSMVACNGKGSPFADFLWCQFLSPLHVTAQTLRSLAVALINQPKDAVMTYLFKAVSRLDLRKTQKPFTLFPHYTIRIQAKSVEQAQAKISRLFAVLSVSTITEGVQYA